jgi:acetylornithine deacetylase/succinyl-diaminopimelate desuccinylase-like protein
MTIAKHITGHRRQFIEELKSFCEFPSVSAQPKHQRDIHACAGWLVTHLRKIGLKTTLHRTDGHPIIVAKFFQSSTLPTVLIYGHYDVQPPEPLHLWNTPPFEPTIRAGKLYARGASDNKGQIFAHIKAVETLLATGRKLPVNIIFLIEGEEEVGSRNLMTFVKQNAKQLRADYIIISDTGMFSKKHPTVTYATRGIAALEVTVTGPSRDLHSGVFGGSVANPASVLSKLLSSCIDDTGHIVVPGFYDDVLPLTKWERQQFARLPFSEKEYAKFLGVPALTGERGFTTLERRWARPTFEINGLTSGYQGPGSKTIVPSVASAKITCRLVPNQRPVKIARAITRHLRKNCPPGVRLRFETGHDSPAFITSPQAPGARAAAAALEEAFGCPSVFTREGGSLPILDVFKRHLRGEIILVGLGLADDNWHSPNEKMDLDNFHRGIQMSAALLLNLGNEKI